MSNALARSLPRFAIAAAVFCLSIATHRSSADVVIPLSIEQLTARADLVLHGSVLAMETRRDEAGRIFTRIEIAVEETWKGELATNRFTVVQGGGVLGDKRTTVTGQAGYKVGERLILFLALNSRGEGVTLGLAQGKFDIVQDAASTELFVRSPFHGGGAAGFQVGRASPSQSASSRLTLSALKQRVKGGAR